MRKVLLLLLLICGSSTTLMAHSEVEKLIADEAKRLTIIGFAAAEMWSAQACRESRVSKEVTRLLFQDIAKLVSFDLSIASAISTSYVNYASVPEQFGERLHSEFLDILHGYSVNRLVRLKKLLPDDFINECMSVLSCFQAAAQHYTVPAE